MVGHYMIGRHGPTFFKGNGEGHSRGHFHFLFYRDPSVQKTSRIQGETAIGGFKRTMVEKNGESTPRVIAQNNRVMDP